MLHNSLRPIVLCILLFASLSPSGLFAQDSAPAAASIPVMRSAYGEKLKLAGLPNGGRVNDSLFRGAQPHAEGLKELQKLGVRTIVELRGKDREKQEWERKQAESLGMRFVSIPVSGWDQPSNEQVAQFLSLFRISKEKVFVHCRLGEDRTGVFVATYRMAYQGWPATQAMNEMYFFGFNGFLHPSMKSFIRDFQAGLKTAADLAQVQPAQDPIQTEAAK